MLRTMLSLEMFRVGPKLIKMGSVDALMADDNLQTLEDVWAVIEASTSSRSLGSVAHMV
jgi:hypothetical protein